jgi:manganese/zinc/iron transport system permease protein
MVAACQGGRRELGLPGDKQRIIDIPAGRRALPSSAACGGIHLQGYWGKDENGEKARPARKGGRAGPAAGGRAMLGAVWAALTLQAGYNAALVALGAALTGLSAGAAGAFMVLRKRALVSDAMAHATLPGVALAFIVMVALGGDGRSLPGLIGGAAITALLGLLTVDWLVRRTRLAEDAAIGAVLSVFFGAGVVGLTVVQTMDAGRQAGLEGFLLGSTAGMLRADALTVAAGGLITAVAIWVLRRPMTMVAFDAGFARSLGVGTRATDLAIMALVLMVTVTGLRIVGLVLIVALLIIPAVTARFWTDRAGRMVWIAGALGAVAGYLGAAISAALPDAPTGPVIVLVAAALFALSLLLAPARGVLAALVRARALSGRVHLRQGLLALARAEAIHDRQTLRVLARAGLIRPDGVATPAGRAAAARTLRDAARWEAARAMPELTLPAAALWPLEELLTPDQLAAVDRRLPPLAGVA